MAVHGDFGVNHLNKKCYFLEVWAISSFCTAIFNGIAMEVGTDALFILTPVGPKSFFDGMVTENSFLRVIPDFPGKNGNWFFLLFFDGYVGKKGHVHGSGKRPYRARG